MTTDRITAVREVCHCGHDRASHHDKKHACSCMGCECGVYADRNGPRMRLMTPAPVPLDKARPSRGYWDNRPDPDTCKGGAECRCFVP